ncbi:hypothetical protein [Candidatus Mycoplasma haematobovis]|nr:hypothetical protein [Candidatus Mycoplasma haematobovis]
MTIPCFLVAGGTGVVGSNWIFKKKYLIKVKDSEEGVWDQKLEELKKMLTPSNTRDEIAQSIGGGEKTNLALNSNNSGFTDVANAKVTLKKWCNGKNHEKEYFDKLCKKVEYKNLIF